MMELWMSAESDHALDMDDLPMVAGKVPWAPPDRPAPGGPGWTLVRGRELRGRTITMVQWSMSLPTAEWLLGEIDWRLECWRGQPDPTGELERGSSTLRRTRAALGVALSAERQDSRKV